MLQFEHFITINSSSIDSRGSSEPNSIFIEANKSSGAPIHISRDPVYRVIARENTSLKISVTGEVADGAFFLLGADGWADILIFDYSAKPNCVKM